MSRHVSSWGRIYGIVAKSFQRFHCSQQPDYFLYPPPILTASPFPSRIRVDKQLNSFPTETHCSTSLYILPLCFFPTFRRGGSSFFKLRFLVAHTLCACSPPPFSGNEATVPTGGDCVYGLQDKKHAAGKYKCENGRKKYGGQKGWIFFSPSTLSNNVRCME